MKEGWRGGGSYGGDSSTLVCSDFSRDIWWVQEAVLALVSKTMKFGSGGRTGDGGSCRPLKHHDRPIR